MKNIFILALLLTSLSFANAQSDEEKVDEVIHKVFDAMRAGDSTVLVTYFIKQPAMKTVYKKKARFSFTRDP
ncbi:hypothetical protein [Mangrovivirga cuniculi]|uniref:Uncharacterized protein n=1 Tax=Mangrovivirga cuniculi TaxID=2715131 RepID=A0A4D7JF79_9BACT|nr:hypothetical protein [Mangrovivirga cuniculi]QCK14321.1 hypothetical protein DCC35_05955 [Mangrovivirga cuniculi]